MTLSTPSPHHAGCMQTSRGSAFGFTGNRNSRANVSAALPASPARFIFDMQAALLACVGDRFGYQAQALKAGEEAWIVESSVTGNTCLEISEVMRNTRMSYSVGCMPSASWNAGRM